MPNGQMKKGLEATKSPTVLDIAWAAGIFEGEGTCTGNSGRPGAHSVQVRVSQKDPYILERFKELFGGSIGQHKGNRGFSKNTEPFIMHTWHVSGARARGFLMTVYKLQSPRRKAQIRKTLGLIN